MDPLPQSPIAISVGTMDDGDRCVRTSDASFDTTKDDVVLNVVVLESEGSPETVYVRSCAHIVVVHASDLTHPNRA